MYCLVNIPEVDLSWTEVWGLTIDSSGGSGDMMLDSLAASTVLFMSDVSTPAAIVVAGDPPNMSLHKSKKRDHSPMATPPLSIHSLPIYCPDSFQF